MTRRNLIVSLLLLATASVCWLVGKRWLFSTPGPADLSSLKWSDDAVAALAETILPRTDTPGAKDAQVEKFIIDMVIHCVSDAEQHTFVRGLERAEQYSQDRFNHSLTICDDSECASIIQWMEQQDKLWLDIPFVYKVRRRFFGRTFFQLLKTLTVEGYCTSEIGATQGLAYDAIPGKYTPCLKIHSGQKAWATA